MNVRSPADASPSGAIRDPARGDVAFSVALFVVALIPRLFVSLSWAREPVWDGHYYHFGAERIAQGFGYSETVMRDGVEMIKPWTHYPVGYSGLLGLLYKIFGSGIEVAPLVNAVLGALTAVAVHRLARFSLNETRSRLAGTICALHPGLIVYSALVMTEPLAALLLILAGLVALVLRESKWQWPAAGVVVGLAALVRPASLLAAPALALVGSRPPGTHLLRTIGQAIVRSGIVLALALVTISPWTIRNCRVMDGCALVSTNGGWNLAIGALTSTGRFRTLRAKDGCPIVTGQVQQDRCWADVGQRVIRDDPGRWLSLVPAKLSQTYDHESFAIEYLHEAAPQLWPEERRLAAHDLLTVFHWLLMTAATLSAVALARPRRGHGLSSPSFWAQATLLLFVCGYAAYSFAAPEHPFFPLMVLLPVIAALPFAGRPFQGPACRYALALVAATSLTHAVFFGDDRYHLVVTPVLCLLAAGALRPPARPNRPSPILT